jgi:hypothetical protein
MFQGISLSTALCLSESDSAALISGQSIAALSRAFINSAQRFALCSVGDTSVVEAWAEHDSCRMYTNPDDAEALSWHTIWPKEFIQSMLQEKNRIFLNTLRVYRLDKPIEIEGGKAVDKIGGFIKLPKSIDISKVDFVLSEATFIQRLQNLQKLSPPEYPELKVLQAAIALHAKDTPVAQTFNDVLQRFLGWADPNKPIANTPDWIKKITTDGNSSNGDLFEKGVRKAFITLGFTNSLNNIRASLDPDATGGAGGLDIYCDKPFSLAGECKATKYETVSSSVAAQLINLGNSNLDSKIFNASVKVLFVAGKLTKAAEKAAVGNRMNIMRPETLQRLVEISHQHSGSIDLRLLEKCLRREPYGEASEKKIQKFLDDALTKVALRSQLIQLVKDCHEKFNVDEVELSSIHGAYAWSQASHPLNSEQIKEILIELSSPLTGYLGRVEDEKGKKIDRFYYLRDLPAPKV